MNQRQPQRPTHISDDPSRYYPNYQYYPQQFTQEAPAKKESDLSTKIGKVIAVMVFIGMGIFFLPFVFCYPAMIAGSANPFLGIMVGIICVGLLFWGVYKICKEIIIA